MLCVNEPNSITEWPARKEEQREKENKPVKDNFTEINELAVSTVRKTNEHGEDKTNEQ